MLTSKELVAKRNSILDAFNKAKEELTNLNTEIESSIASNKEQLSLLVKENESLVSIRTINQNSLKNLNKILG